MEHYLCHTDYPIWQVIQNGNGLVSVTTNTNGMINMLPSKTAEEVVARKRERKARTTLLMALLEDHLAKFHKMVDAKEMWEAIKSRFGGNDESKKMQKYLLKQQFEGFFVSSSKGLHKGYDRLQTLLSQLEIHGAGVSHEDANQKFLRSLPSSWSQVTLIMRTKPGLGTLSFDDLYNNLRVFKHDVKGTTASSSSNTQNVAFVYADNTNSTNDVSTAYSVSSPSVLNSQKEGSASYTDEINDDDLEEMDLKWQVAMISTRIKKYHKRTGRKLAKWNQDSKKRKGGYNGDRAKDNGRIPAYQDDSKALVTMDGEDIDWSGHVEEHTQNFAMMAYSSNNSGSDNETLVDESDSKPVEYASSDSNSRVEITTSMPATVKDTPKVVSKPKVWTDTPIIEEYESDRDDDLVSNVTEEKEKPSFTFTDTTKHDDPYKALKDKGIIDSGCSSHMTGNKTHLADYQEFKGGSVAFGGSNGRITGKGKIKADRNAIQGLLLGQDSELCESTLTDFTYGFIWTYLCLKEANHSACTQATDDQGAHSEEINLHDEHFVLPIWSAYSTTVKSSGDKLKRMRNQLVSTNLLTVVSVPVGAVGPSRALNDDEPSYPEDLLIPHLEDIFASPSEWIFTNSSNDDKGVVTDYNNLETTVNVNPTSTTRIHTIHPKTQILGDPMIEAIRIFLAFASYMGFIVYQMDVKSAFMYGTIDEVYVTQPLGFVDPKFPNKVYKVVKALYGLHQAHRAWFQMSSMGKLTFFLGLQVKQKEDGIFISQDKYVAEILKKFDFLNVKTASTPIETQKPLVKDKEAANVDVHLIDSDYVGANLDRKSTIGGCQFLGKRLISWQCKKQTIVVTSTTKAEYVVDAHSCG
uniref:Uncharacterized protein n=1 Tax=Tanacetum cinerariifolium TaxID=118510 RepID=A0A6L2LE68_TANCI|nr:hypothetical protein [Tanacetum cinerariifolium]